MRKHITYGTLSLAVLLLTGVNISIDEASTVLEVLFQLSIPVVVVAYKYFDQNGNLWPDVWETKPTTPKEPITPKEESDENLQTTLTP
jgi:hypothetical protein